MSPPTPAAQALAVVVNEQSETPTDKAMTAVATATSAISADDHNPMDATVLAARPQEI